ncbi:guanylate cyclase 32E-like, partial [Stegodyphus dumicola]|uniref:guanylate cyclase 32E-like n=1 Tax=Stegodyphus dumicola TaxID=202533 RepID=UPI0015B1FD26
MAVLVLVTSLVLALAGADLQPHRTVVDLTRFSFPLEKTLCDTSKPNVTIGFLSSFKDIGKLIAGAVPLAVDMVNVDPELLPDHNLRFIFHNSGSPDSSHYESPMSIRKMTQMKQEGVVAFIGLDQGCEHEALVAAAWDMPMISYKCSDSKVSNKDIFTTFARTLPPSSKVSKSLISLLKHFDWTKLMLLVANNTSDKSVAEALSKLAIENDIEIVQTFYLPADYLTKHNTTLRDIILQTYMRTR